MRREQQIGVEVLRVDELADEGVAVGVQARGGEAEDNVPRLAARSVDQIRSPDEADARSGEVELSFAVDPWELGGLSAEDRTAGLAADGRGALDEVGDLLEVEAARSHVVEEEERVGARGDDVVDAVGGEIAAGVPQAAGAPRERDLRPDAVGRRHEEPLVVELVEPGKAANLSSRRGNRGA